MAKIKLRRDTAANWLSVNPVLALGEPGYNTTDNKIKVGDGTSTWTLLNYLTDITGSGATDRLTSSTYSVILEGTTGTVSVPNAIISQGYQLNLAGSEYSYNIGRYLRLRDGDIESHIHLDTPDNSLYDIILGDDSKFVRVDHTGTVVIGTVNFLGSPTTYNTWTFSVNGNLTLPSGNTTIGNTLGSDAIISAPDTAFGVLSQGSTGFNGLQWFDTIVEPLNVAGIVVNSPYAASTGSVQIYTGVVGIPFQNAWTFDPDGTTTLPGAVINSTVAKTGVVLPTTTGTVSSLTSSPSVSGLTDGSYPFTLGVVTFTVVVFSGVINGTSNISSTSTVTINDVIGTIDSGDLGGTTGTTITWTVANVVQETPTAIDLTKTVNKLTDGSYTLANGTEGQIMHLVRQTGTTATNILVTVANARVDGIVYTPLDYAPFNLGLAGTVDISTLIFTDSAWQATTGTWD